MATTSAPSHNTHTHRTLTHLQTPVLPAPGQHLQLRRAVVLCSNQLRQQDAVQGRQKAPSLLHLAPHRHVATCFKNPQVNRLVATLLLCFNNPQVNRLVATLLLCFNNPLVNRLVATLLLCFNNPQVNRLVAMLLLYFSIPSENRLIATLFQCFNNPLTDIQPDYFSA